MHAKPDLRVVLNWMIAGSGSVITAVIRLKSNALQDALMFIKTCTFLCSLSLFFHCFANAQQTDSDETGIPLGYKVIAIYRCANSDAIEKLLQKGDLVNVITGDSEKITIAKGIKVYSKPKREANSIRKRPVVTLLAQTHIADAIMSVHDEGDVQLAITRSGHQKRGSFENSNARGKIEVTPSISADKKEKARTLASALDKIAAELESVEMYNRADELREQAQNLRLDVR